MAFGRDMEKNSLPFPGTRSLDGFLGLFAAIGRVHFSFRCHRLASVLRRLFGNTFDLSVQHLQVRAVNRHSRSTVINGTGLGNMKVAQYRGNLQHLLCTSRLDDHEKGSIHIVTGHQTRVIGLGKINKTKRRDTIR